MTFRTAAVNGASRRFALMSTYEVLAQLTEDMLHPQLVPPTQTEIRPAIRRNRGQMRSDTASVMHFHLGVVIVSQLPRALFDLPSVSGGKRTHRGHRVSLAMTLGGHSLEGCSPSANES